jgi:manganese/zinc/iron transport system substrate-binding protein
MMTRAILMTHRRISSPILSTLCLLVASGCQPATTPPASNGSGTAGNSKGTATVSTPYTVVTTCGMVTDIVSIVAGEHGHVSGLMGEGVDPHMYKPTRNDQKILLGADIIFYSGLMLEGRMSDTFIGVSRTGKSVYAVTEQIDESYLRQPPEFDGHWDPHVWMDITAWSQCVDVVAEALSDYDAAHAEGYKTRATEYRVQLREMDDYVRKSIATIPQDQRWLITAHDAFGYFSQAYKIPVKSAQGISTDSESAVDDINQLVRFIVENRIGAIFVESSVNPKNIQAIIEGCQQKNWTVQVGGKLYSDAMGAPGTYTGTYLGMMDHNATTITRALGGQAPETGQQGKLVPGPSIE